MKNFIEKNKVLLLILFIVILVAITIVSIYKNKIQNAKLYEVNEKNYSFQYDNTWKLAELNETEIKLFHKKSNSELNIKINELEDEVQYKHLDEILDGLLYNIQEQNKEYKLLYKENIMLTKNNLNSYKLLYENDSNQVEICLYKQGNKIVIITYQAPYEYFDILLDSANNIIYSFSLNEQKFDVLTSINLETKEITYSEQKEILDLLSDTTQEQIADKNYLVNYSIPSNFKTTENNTEKGSYKFENLSSGESINLRTNIFNINLYEYLDKENSSNIYQNYIYNKDNEQLNKFGDEPLSYIYKSSYLTNNSITENIVIVFELNKNHILKVEINSRGVGIPEELVKMIKINKIENYASNKQ